MTRLLFVITAACLAAATGCECLPGGRYVPPQPPPLAEQAYADVEADIPADAARLGGKGLTTLAVAGARAAEGGFYLDVVVHSPAATLESLGDARTVARRISGNAFPPWGVDREVLRLRDSAGRDITARPGRSLSSRRFCLWYIPSRPVLEWVSRLDSEDGIRYAATIRLVTDHPVSLGSATLFPPADPADDVEGALHRILRIGADGAAIEVRQTHWMAWQPSDEEQLQAPQE